eukprot:scaffold7641_cov115-Cylindrotheca_fusiformis.AAC.33
MISHISHPSEASEQQQQQHQQQRRSLRQSMSPTTVRKAVEDNKNADLFSPTSAAALALSTLHHFGAQRDSRATLDETDIKGTRLFNSNGAVAPPAPPTNEPQVSLAYRSSSPSSFAGTTSAPATAAAASGCYPFQSFPQNNYNNGADHLQHHHQQHHQQPPHSVSWGGAVNLASASGGYPYPSYAQTDSRSSLARASPAYPDEQHATYNHLQPRGSPVAMMGQPPMSCQTAFHPSQQPASGGPAKFGRLASCASTLVTPTPKKAKLDHPTKSSSSAASTYSRKKKSLGILAENFLNTYQGMAKGATIVVDEAAVKLGVERRRIYDVVNILESICLVCKKHKNTYTWMGMEHLDAVFGRLQSQAIAEYPQDAEKYLGSKDRKAFVPVPLKPPRKQSKTRENKSLAKLSQEFLQVFLVGHETLSLPEASDKIQGTTSTEELIAIGSNTAANVAANSEKELKAAAARGLKTKIRRLYDIANVFLSVGLLKKVDSADSSRRPNFSWSYRVSAKELYQLHRPHDEEDTTNPPVATKQEEDNGFFREQ